MIDITSNISIGLLWDIKPIYLTEWDVYIPSNFSETR